MLKEEVSDNVRQTYFLGRAHHSIDKVVQDVGKISTSVRKGVETVQKDILAKATIFLDIINAIKGFFEKKKKASPSKKKGTTVYRYKYKKDQEKPEEVEIQTNGEIEEEPYADYAADTGDGELEAGSEKDAADGPDDASAADPVYHQPDALEDTSAVSLDDSIDVSDSADREDTGEQ